jgi:hypothetical protein
MRRLAYVEMGSYGIRDGKLYILYIQYTSNLLILYLVID